MKIFIFFFILLTTTLAYLIGESIIPFLFTGSFSKSLAWGTHLGLISSIILGPFLSRVESKQLDTPLFKFYHWMAYHLMGFYLILLSIILIRPLLLGFIKIEIAYSVYTWGAIVLSVLLSSWGYVKATKLPLVIKVYVPIKNLPKDLVGFKIVQLSDVHVGITIKKDFVEKIVGISNSLSPHIVALTGDLIDGRVQSLKEDVAPFKNLLSTYGTFYAPGNHEYYWGLESWMKEFSELDFKILLNENQKIKVGETEIVIGGVHDLSSNRINRDYKCDPTATFYNTDESLFRILLAHQPNTIKKLNKTKVDLVLSGHTHAGQFFPASILVHLFQTYVKGLHRVGDLWIYINQGTGFWGPPNRLGTKSEITLLELVAREE